MTLDISFTIPMSKVISWGLALGPRGRGLYNLTLTLMNTQYSPIVNFYRSMFFSTYRSASYTYYVLLIRERKFSKFVIFHYSTNKISTYNGLIYHRLIPRQNATNFTSVYILLSASFSLYFVYLSVLSKHLRYKEILLIKKCGNIVSPSDTVLQAGTFVNLCRQKLNNATFVFCYHADVHEQVVKSVTF